MVFQPPQPDFPALVGRCCAGGRDREFAAFRAAWHPYLEAGLALVGVDWNTADKLIESIYDEYREIFRDPFNPRIDYETYLLAVGYSRLMEERGEHLPRQVLPQTPAKLQAMTPHEVNILVFSAILRTPGGCISQLLHACFPPRQSGRGLLQTVLGSRPKEPLQAASACIQNLQRILAPLR